MRQEYATGRRAALQVLSAAPRHKTGDVGHTVILSLPYRYCTVGRNRTVYFRVRAGPRREADAGEDYDQGGRVGRHPSHARVLLFGFQL